jgi:hypothetical protein
MEVTAREFLTMMENYHADLRNLILRGDEVTVEERDTFVRRGRELVQIHNKQEGHFLGASEGNMMERFETCREQVILMIQGLKYLKIVD